MFSNTKLTFSAPFALFLGSVLAANCVILAPACTSPGPQMTYLPEPCFPSTGVCHPTHYYAAQDQGQLSAANGAFNTQLKTKCSAICNNAGPQCASFVGAVNKSANSSLATGTCFLYSVKRAYPRRCVDSPSQIIAYYKQSVCSISSTTSTAKTTTSITLKTTTKSTTASNTKWITSSATKSFTTNTSSSVIITSKTTRSTTPSTTFSTTKTISSTCGATYTSSNGMANNCGLRDGIAHATPSFSPPNYYAVFNGQGVTEDPNNPGNDDPHRPSFTRQFVNIPAEQNCVAIDACANACAPNYWSFDLHYYCITKVWECVCYGGFQYFGDYFNVPNPLISQVYGYSAYFDI